MGVPQIIVIVLYALSLGVSLCKHGEYSKNNFFYSLVSVAIVFGLLIWGGFFGA